VPGHMFKVSKAYILTTSPYKLISIVFANSAVASILTLLHAYQLYRREQDDNDPKCYSWPGDILVVGIVANYAAVAADTFSSELGILSKSRPRLITSLNLRKVPPGTNGGVTGTGLAAGLLGSLIIVAASVALIPFCSPKDSIPGTIDLRGWGFKDRQRFATAMALWGALGSVLDSLLGGWLQQSIVDTRSGRIVEGAGGKKVLISRENQGVDKASLLKGKGKNSTSGHRDDQPTIGVIRENMDRRTGGMDKYDATKKFRKPSFGDEKPSRVVESGALGILDNNEVNFLMALTMSLSAMAIASWFWGVPLSTILPV
jgi:uncharacterized membrane protein